MPSLPTGADPVTGAINWMIADPVNLAAVSAWYHGGQSIQNLPQGCVSLTGEQLGEFAGRLPQWFAAAAPPVTSPVSAQASAPSTGPTQAPLPHSMQQPAHSSGMQPPGHSLPAQNTQMQQQHVSLPAQTLNQGQQPFGPLPAGVQPVQRAGGGIKLPKPPTFKGDPASSTPQGVQHFLRCMELALRSENSPDPVLVAVMHLQGTAADWRDTVFLPANSGHPGNIIPWAIFERQFKERFMDRVSCMDAWERFRNLSQGPKQSVLQYNEQFNQSKLELAALPYVSVPDASSQVDIYVRGLHGDIAAAVYDHADLSRLEDLEYFMHRAATVEALKKTMRMRLAGPKQSETKSVHGDAQQQKRKSGSGANASQGTSSQQASQPSKKNKQDRRKQNKGKGPASGKVIDPEILQIPQHKGSHKLTGVPELKPEQIASLQGDAARNVKGTDGKMYPNQAFRYLAMRDRRLKGQCFGCEQPLQSHAKGQCPNPEVRPKTRHAGSHVTACTSAASDSGTAHAVTGLEIAQSSLAENRASFTRPQNTEIAAVVHAKPYCGVTMVFAGAVQQATPVNVLVDTGSSHNACRPGLVDPAARTGRSFSVVTAGSQNVTHAPELSCSVTVQSIATRFTACELDLPEGIDILLGQTWMTDHKATLLTWSGQVNFLDDEGLPAVWCKRKSMADNPYNSTLKWSSAATVGKGKRHYVAFVRAASDRPGACRESSIVASTIATETGIPHADVSASRLQDVFVEQQSAVKGIQELIKQYQVVFSEDIPAGLPPDRGIHHAIPTEPGAKAPASKVYRLSKPQREEMERQIRTLLLKGWIRPSSSPYGSPILFVKKKDGGMRMCVDYRAVNKMTVRNSYPLPRIDDLLDKMTGASIFSCLDLQQAYHQIRLNQDDIPKTAFTTPQGLYEYMVLPFGLSNAPSTFQAVINSILGPELRHCCLVYLDDIVVFSKTPEEHLHHLQMVLAKLQSAKLYAKLSKCRFALSSIKYCGHVLDAKGVLPDPDKVQAVLDWPTPVDVHQVRQFVGLAQYFRKFMQAFPVMIAPLTGLFKKGVEFNWNSACQRSFQQIKTALTSVPCLKLPDPDEPFTVITDASGIGVGGILMQQGRPVAFEGRKLTDTEKKWSATEQEMLGVVYHLDKWRCYLEGVHFTVVTDHQPNTWFASQKQLSPRQARWYEKLRSFDFTWEYRPGRLNAADPLSRNPAYCNVIQASLLPSSPAAEFVSMVTLRSSRPAAGQNTDSQALHSPVSHKREFRSMMEQTKSLRWGKGAPDKDTEAAMDDKPAEAQSKRAKRKRRRIEGKSPVSSKLAATQPDSMPTEPAMQPASMQNPDLHDSLADSDMHSNHGAAQNKPAASQGNAAPRGHMQSDDQPDQVPVNTGSESAAAAQNENQNMQHAPDAVDTLRAPAHLAEDAGVHGGDAPMHSPLTDPGQVLLQIKDGYTADPLYGPLYASSVRRTRLGMQAHGSVYRRGQAICVPDVGDLHTNILRELHCSPYAGHVGMNRTLRLVSRFFYWPNMQDDINKYVQGCVVCQRNKPATGLPAGKLQPLPVPSGVWEDISMDFIGPLPKTERGHDFILNVVDRLSKMAHFLPCKQSIDAEGVASLFVDRIWSMHGLPKSIVTDRGTQFLNSFNTAICRILGTRHAVSSAYHPQTDGQTERVNRVLEEMLRHYTNKQYDDWDLHLPLCEFAHNNAPSTATGMSPFFVCFGKHPRTPMQAVADAANAEWEQEPQLNSQFLGAHEFIAAKQEIVRNARAAMESARQRMARYEDPKRTALTFAVGDQVSLKTKHLGISTLPSRKLFPVWLGPFTVSKVINPAAYQLELPNMWKAHNVFHSSLLKPYRDNGEAVDPQSFTLVGGKDNEFEVESITDYGPKTAHANGKLRKASELVFWVKWRGVAAGIDCRQPYANVRKNAESALQDLALRYNLPKDVFEKPSSKIPVRAVT